jgi:hypothetical protein
MWLTVMLRLLLLLLLAAPASVRLYLKDGSHHVVREYQVQNNRVRYYSVERSDWEEIPLELVDLKRTEAEQKEAAENDQANQALAVAEDTVDLTERREAARIPMDPGVYFLESGKVVSVQETRLHIAASGKRKLYQILSPIPVVAGKSTLEIDGEHSARVFTGQPPMLFFRLYEEERFALVRCKQKKGVRVVEEWAVEPVSKQIFPKRDTVDVFRRQAGERLYRIWPTEPLAPGEYAVVEFTEGTENLRAWDFAVKGAEPTSRPR